MRITKEMEEFSELAHANAEIDLPGFPGGKDREWYLKGYWGGINFGGAYIIKMIEERDGRTRLGKAKKENGIT